MDVNQVVADANRWIAYLLGVIFGLLRIIEELVNNFYGSLGFDLNLARD